MLGVVGLRADNTGPFVSSAPVPTVDMWMYPHAGSPGTRTTASTFSALPADGGVDDRFAQFLLKFNTVAAGIPAGLGAENYDPSKLVLTAVMTAVENVPYDPTEDPRNSYGPSALADLDSGRPIEIHGAGFRGNFTASTFLETSSFGSGTRGGRNAYALGYSPTAVARDVSNNVTSGFDSLPWGIGKVLVSPGEGEPYVELAAGTPIPAYAHVVFELNLSLPGVKSYVQNALNQGFIWLTVSSLHSAAEMGSSGYPSFFTKENVEQIEFQDVATSLQVEYSLPVRIISLERNAEAQTARLTWAASPGFQYVVETSQDLTVGSWAPLGIPYTTQTATNLSWSGNSTSARAFFRIARKSLP